MSVMVWSIMTAWRRVGLVPARTSQLRPGWAAREGSESGVDTFLLDLLHDAPALLPQACARTAWLADTGTSPRVTHLEVPPQALAGEGVVAEQLFDFVDGALWRWRDGRGHALAGAPSLRRRSAAGRLGRFWASRGAADGRRQQIWGPEEARVRKRRSDAQRGATDGGGTPKSVGPHNRTDAHCISAVWEFTLLNFRDLTVSWRHVAQAFGLPSIAAVRARIRPSRLKLNW
jgi:hypothetical protein